MGKWMSAIAGLLMPETIGYNDRDTAPLAQPPRTIEGGSAAPELCMLPKEWPGMAEWVNPDVTRGHRRVTQIKADGINAVKLPGQMVGGREGGPLDCAMHCYPGLARLEAAIGTPMVFLGEYVAHDGFNATLAEYKAGIGDGAFWLYDAIPHAAWVSGREYGVPIEKRLTDLRDAFVRAETGLFVGFLDFWLLNGAETAAKAAEVWAAGYEGLVSKKPGSGYARRRDDRWLKVKERFRAPCQIIDCAIKDSRLHRVIVRGPEPSGSKPLTLARGWSPDEERRIAENLVTGRDNLVAEIEFDLTVGATRSVRGAVWKGLL